MSRRSHVQFHGLKTLFLVFVTGVLLLFLYRLRCLEQSQNPVSLAPILFDLSSSPATIEGLATTSSSIKLDDKPQAEIAASQPFLPDDRPDWVAQPDKLDGKIHHISVATELASSVEECRGLLDSALLAGVRRYINEHLSSSHVSASELVELTPDWIRSHLLLPDREFVTTTERPVGTYHQLWVELKIDPDDRQQMESWIRGVEIKHRAGFLGIAGAGLIAALSMANAGLRLFVKHD